MAVLKEGERVGRGTVPLGKAGLLFVGATTIDGLLLSRGFLFRPSFAGLVQVARWHPYRFIDLVDYGRDPSIPPPF